MHAYRASDDLASALRTWRAEAAEFQRDVIGAWDAEHPDTRSRWVSGVSGLRCVGFTDPGDIAAPPGLSRNRQRDYLIPKRGAAGDPWREAMGRLNQCPPVAGVWRRFGIDPGVLSISESRLYLPQVRDTLHGLFVTWGVPKVPAGDHLTEVPLSAFYAAVEQMGADRV